jgi:hypothetical protein
MLHNIFKATRNISCNENMEYVKQSSAEITQAVKRRQEELKKFNGKMRVSDRGSISIEFKTLGDKNDYYKHQLNSIASRVNM